jgi:auxin-responsive protein IAA
MGDSKAREPLPRLLDLIPDGKQWKGREAPAGAGRSRNTGFGSEEEDKKLELKLGPPGLIEEGTTTAAVSRDEGIQREIIPTLSLGCFPHKPSKPAINTTATGTKRGFLDTIEAKTEGT